jgi:hypothetical protein
MEMESIIMIGDNHIKKYLLDSPGGNSWIFVCVNENNSGRWGNYGKVQGWVYRR